MSKLIGKTWIDGNEALAWGAALGQIDYFTHYPGSPVNRVANDLEEIDQEHELGIKFNHALNEHVAILAAAGASLCGARSMVVMKHVGLNIAADPANYLGVTGVKGGMVIVVGTDPGATCSTGEEDVHWYVPQFNLPLLEPVSIPQIVESIPTAFELSERYSLPVLLFLPATLCFNSDAVDLPSPPARRPVRFHFEQNRDAYTHVGAKAVQHHAEHLQRIADLRSRTWRAREFFNSSAPVGIISRGAAHCHTYEAIIELGLEEGTHLLTTELVYPLNESEIRTFAANKERILVVEDQDGFLEFSLKNLLYNESPCPIHGKDRLPSHGDLDYQMVLRGVADFLGCECNPPPRLPPVEIPERLGTYCEGCPHRSTFFGIDQVVGDSDTIIGGDIGCSSLPPHRPDWLLCMNAGIGLSQGMAQVVDEQSIISTGGEGSFFHMGIISLLNAVHNKIDFLHLVFDNRIVAMTGHQLSPTSEGHDQQVDHRKLLESLGVDHIFEANAFLPFEVKYRLEQAQKLSGVRVLWVRGNCAYFPDAEHQHRRKVRTLHIHNDKCGSCRTCFEDLGCPAINERPGSTDIYVDLDRCARCGVCLEVCPNEAIEVQELKN